MEGVTQEELKDRLLKPLLRELQDGARDRVVVGGLEALVQNLARPFPKLLELFRGYGEKPQEERKRVLQEALRLLEGQGPSPKGQAQASSRRLAPSDPANLLALSLIHI